MVNGSAELFIVFKILPCNKKALRQTPSHCKDVFLSTFFVPLQAVLKPSVTVPEILEPGARHWWPVCFLGSTRRAAGVETLRRLNTTQERRRDGLDEP